jgi:hypothetical protein
VHSTQHEWRHLLTNHRDQEVTARGTAGG